MLSSEFGEIRAAGQFRSQCINLGAGFLWPTLGFIRTDHDVGAAQFSPGFPTAGQLDDVVAVAGANGPHHIAHLGFVAGVLEGVEHHEGAEPSEVPPIVLDAWVVASSA